MSDDLTLDDYLVPGEGENEPQAIYERLVRECEEFVHLKDGEPNMLILFRTFEKIKAGHVVLGTCHIPSVQGELKPMFEWMMVKQFGFYPDFLIVLDKAFWDGADDATREALMFHEMMHAGQKRDQYGAPMFNKETGIPVWTIVGHDIEEFNATVKRYGAWHQGISRFISDASGIDSN